MSPLEFPYLGETERLTPTTRAGLPGEFVELPLGRVHYQSGGPPDAPAIVLIHGFSTPYFIWDPTYDALLEAGFHVVRYDLYGRGYSDRPHLRYDRDLFVRQLHDLVDGLALQGPLNLVGLSMGGIIAADFTARFPARVRSLALLDPAGFPLGFSPALTLITIPLLGELLFNLIGNGTLLKNLAADFFVPQHVAHFFDQYRLQMRFKGFKRAILSTLRSGMLNDALPLYQAVGERGHPVLLIWGRHDQTVPFKHSAEVLNAVPQTQFHPIDQAGHIPHFECPQVVNPLLIEFFRD